VTSSLQTRIQRHPAGSRPRLDGSPSSTASGWRHLPALDGVRGLAVLAVLLYHAGVRWLPGGLLGVDAFFVLSGFLITGLLLNEWRSTGRLELRTFWARRARRLLPALLLLLVLVSIDVAVTGSGTSRSSFRWDALSTLGYVANWRFAFSHQGYFGATSPSPLLHLWSLGVEEQFYLLWPLVVFGLLRAGRRVRGHDREALGDVSILLALASTFWMAFLIDHRHASTDRLYYGTDTRAAALLVGAALAALAGRVRVPTLAGVAGLAGLFTIWSTTSGQAGWLYRGGFLLTALTVALVIGAVAAAPRSLLSRSLALRPLAWVGRISYARVPLPLAALPAADPSAHRARRNTAAAAAARSEHRPGGGQLLRSRAADPAPVIPPSAVACARSGSDCPYGSGGFRGDDPAELGVVDGESECGSGQSRPADAAPPCRAAS
jgi:peptidoglycan/LPS O-acetylase OafA/YrhL